MQLHNTYTIELYIYIYNRFILTYTKRGDCFFPNNVEKKSNTINNKVSALLIQILLI